jgi:hypothetical protein
MVFVTVEKAGQVDVVPAQPSGSASGPSPLSSTSFRRCSPSGRRHRPRQLLQLNVLGLPPLEDRLLDIRRQKGEVQQAGDIGAVDLLGLGDLRNRAAPALFRIAGLVSSPTLGYFSAGPSFGGTFSPLKPAKSWRTDSQPILPAGRGARQRMELPLLDADRL